MLWEWPWWWSSVSLTTTLTPPFTSSSINWTMPDFVAESIFLVLSNYLISDTSSWSSLQLDYWEEMLCSEIDWSMSSISWDSSSDVTSLIGLDLITSVLRLFPNFFILPIFSSPASLWSWVWACLTGFFCLWSWSHLKNPYFTSSLYPP